MTMTRYRRSIAAGFATVCVMLTTSAGAEVIVYPKAGQSAEAFQQDQLQCHQIAQQNTGFNPAQAAAAPPPPQQGGAARGAARGAAVGAAAGAIGGDAGKGAAAGAAAGAVGGRMRQNDANRQNAQMAQQQQMQQQNGMQAYDNSYAACMAQRGYQPK